jgi:transcriptional regulator with PAS, ATPase and Fis domain
MPKKERINSCNEMNIWSEEFEGAITICDREGIITYMNDASKKVFIKDGGGDLVGTNLLDCHPEPSRSKLEKMLKEPSTNTYTIEKAGIKKIIHQSPLYENGVFSGMIEMSFVLPHSLPHFIRG